MATNKRAGRGRGIHVRTRRKWAIERMEAAMIDVVALSGGADSTALALKEPNATLIFTDTGWEFPELYAHLDKIERITGREIIRLGGATLPELIMKKKFLPNHGARWCTREVKIKPMNEYLKGVLPARLLIGLRADEPLRVGNLTQMEGLEIAYPLREQGMNRTDVVRLCMEYDLMPRYPVYMARGGCIGCYYKRKSEVQAMVTLVPGIIDELQQLEESVQDDREKFFHMFPNVGQSIRELRRQGTLPGLEAIYSAASDNSDKGTDCGLFCHR